MTSVATLGIDLAKSVFSVHGVDRSGKAVLRRTVRREQLTDLIANLQPCRIRMEACSGAHEWARRFGKHGHDVRLMARQFIGAYQKGDKNDGNDAEAICEAVSHPSMRFVPVKSVKQQAVLTLHRVRQGFVEERTAIVNRMRGLLAEFGIVIPIRPIAMRRQVPDVLEMLPTLAAGAIADLHQHYVHLEQRVREYDGRIAELVRQSATRCPSLMADHVKVKALFKACADIKESGAAAEEKIDLVAQSCYELTAHASLEEEIFYPAVRAAIEEADLMDEALVEHAGAKALIAQLRAMTPDDELYDAKVTILGEQIQHHVKEEEGEMFLAARQAKVDTEAVGGAMATRKADLVTELGGSEAEDAESRTGAQRRSKGDGSPRGRSAG